MLILSTNVDKKLLETDLSIAICRPNGFSCTVVDCFECLRLPPTRCDHGQAKILLSCG